MHRGMQKKIYVITAMIIAVFMLVVSGCTKEQEELMELTEIESEDESPKDESEKGTEEEAAASALEESGPDTAGTIYVHVCGEVICPGVYELRSGSRLYEAIAAAGGLSEQAAGEQLNQASLAEDGQQIYVPSKEEAALAGASGQDISAPDIAAADDDRISLNTASKEQLMTLSGIGEAKAASIISYREEHGGFQKIEELMEVEGIKEGVFNKVKDKIKI